MAALAISLSARPLLAAEPGREQKVALSISACPEAFDSSLRRILAIELGELLAEAPSTASKELESIDVACEAEMARITARNLGAGEVAHNDVRFDAFPGDAAPRAVALAALEALRAVDPTLAERIEAQKAKANPDAVPSVPVSAPRATPAQPTPSERSSSTPLESEAFTRLVLGGLVRAFLGAPATTSVGARLELSRRFAAAWDAGFDVDGTFAQRKVNLGEVHAMLLSTAAWFGLRAGSVTWSATAGLGGRIGVALLRGAPGNAARGHDSARPVGGPMLLSRGDGAIGPMALALTLEAGLALASAEGLAGGAPVVGYRNGWIAVSSNAGVRF
jgi:hypothetical protein